MPKTHIEILAEIQREVAARERLRSEDPEYAGVFRNQFETITGKVEHVISELLQNADDAEAQSANIIFDGEYFTLQHDGADFSESQFRAICSFAVSSKHTFKTTGFRGIGFKSTFSLGNTVYLITSNFQVKFEYPRITYPVKLEGEVPDPKWPVTIRVPVKEDSRSELASSLHAWRIAPCSLLFFRNLKEGVYIGNDHFEVGREPNAESSRDIKKNGETIWQGRLMSFTSITLPEDACAEIARLRSASIESDSQSTTQIDILQGQNEEGRIYSILPTSGGKRLRTRFAINSSFVLGPERDGIKSPSQSATNRFLFAEAGRIVARHLLTILETAKSFSANLLHAYSLLPLEPRIAGSDAEAEASRRLQSACLDELNNHPWVLTANFRAIRPTERPLVELPLELSEVWPPRILRKIFSPDAEIIHPKTPDAVLKWLKNCGRLTALDASDLLHSLKTAIIPRPRKREQLFKLWTWAAKNIVSHQYLVESQAEKWIDVKILPVESEAYLESLGKVYNFSKETANAFRRNGISLSQLGLYKLDTGFVSKEYLKSSNPPQGWWTMMDCNTVGITRVRSLSSMLANVTRIVGTSVQSRKSMKALWRIHQDADILLDKELPVLRENGEAVPISKRHLIVRSRDINIDDYLPPKVISYYALDQSLYPTSEHARVHFYAWLRRAGAIFFPFPSQFREKLENSHKAQDYALKLGTILVDAKNGEYACIDYCWTALAADFWAEISKQRLEYYEELLQQLVKHHRDSLLKVKQVTFERRFGTQWMEIKTQSPLASGWARFFRDKACIRSKSGRLHRPTELYITSPATLDIINAGEPTVATEIHESYGTDLLSLIGCKSSPPDLLAFSRLIVSELDASQPKIERVHRLLLAANPIVAACGDGKSKDDFLKVLSERRSIPSTKGKLEKPEDLVQESDSDDAVAVVHAELRGTPIIAALGVRQTPSRESDIAWIDAEIGTDIELPKEALKKLKRLLSQPSSVSEHLWGKNRWLALNGQVRKLDQFKFRHSARDELPVENISAPQILAATADFCVISPLPKELSTYSKPELLSCLVGEACLRKDPISVTVPWLASIAKVLWTEAEKSGEHREVLESLALQWRDANVVLDRELSRRFSINGQRVADGIRLDAAWASPACFAIRAEDEDDICERTEAIARGLREGLGNIRPKTVLKLSAWIARPSSQIEKLGLKALMLPQLRPWPEKATLKDDAIQTDMIEGSPSSGETGPDGSSVLDARKNKTTSGASLNVPAGSASTSTNDGNLDSVNIQAGKSNRQLSLNDENDDYGGSEGAGNRANQPSRYRGHRNYKVAEEPRKNSFEHDPTMRHTKAPPPPQSGERMRSYLEHSMDRRERERQRTQAIEDGESAEEIVVAWEAKHLRTARRIGGNNPGYDILSTSSGETDKRYIEVKSIAGEWGGTGVRLTPTQFAYAEELGDRYWLYVVENAKTSSPVIHAIQNPAAHISAFCFDCGWREIAEVVETNTPPSLFIPKVGETVIFDEQEVVVEKVESRGAFVLATFKIGDRTYRKMNTALSPKA